IPGPRGSGASVFRVCRIATRWPLNEVRKPNSVARNSGAAPRSKSSGGGNRIGPRTEPTNGAERGSGGRAGSARTDVQGAGACTGPSVHVFPRRAGGRPRDDGEGRRRGDREGQGNRVAGPVHMIAFVTTNEGKFREVSAKLLEAGVRVVHEDRSYPEIQTDRL